jgi:hypothetical protein
MLSDHEGHSTLHGKSSGHEGHSVLPGIIVLVTASASISCDQTNSP